ncbi:MspA family porin [Nocardia anaemiae]|uniref:MspA family porin n=1 Tax=Nocardia anaemiae TaxID=263910 RepID=UPI001FE03CBD|nr:MspA family porin [Nocardia anaemiae]
MDPPGDRMPNFLMTFAHAAQLSGNYSLNVEGDGIVSGQAVAGFLLGCALSLDNGFTVGIDPNQGLLASISPEFSQSNAAARLPSTPVSTPPSAKPTPVSTPQRVGTTSPSVATTSRSVATTSQSAAPTSQSAATTSPSAAPTSQSAAPTSQSAATTSPSVETTSPSVETTSPSVETTSPSVETTSPSAPSASLGPTVGGTLGLTQVLEATLAPGQITTVTTVTTNLDNKTVFPYHFIFNNAALNVGQCASPVSAVPFVTATVSTAVETVQTSAYGSQFTF